MTDAADSPTPVEDLLARARAYVTHSHAKNTLNAYAADWKHFSEWCDDHKRRALPASPETILCYVVDLVDHYTVATIDRRLSSIGYYHKQARHTLPTNGNK
jgi:site-specific recombinase XerD